LSNLYYSSCFIFIILTFLENFINFRFLWLLFFLGSFVDLSLVNVLTFFFSLEGVTATQGSHWFLELIWFNGCLHCSFCSFKFGFSFIFFIFSSLCFSCYLNLCSLQSISLFLKNFGFSNLFCHLFLGFLHFLFFDCLFFFDFFKFLLLLTNHVFWLLKHIFLFVFVFFRRFRSTFHSFSVDFLN